MYTVRSKKAFIIFKKVDNKWKFFQNAKWVEEYKPLTKTSPKYMKRFLSWVPVQWFEESDCDHEPMLMYPKDNEVFKPSLDNTRVCGGIGLEMSIPKCRRCGKYYETSLKKKGVGMEMLPYWLYLAGSLCFAAGSIVVMIKHYFGFTF